MRTARLGVLLALLTASAAAAAPLDPLLLSTNFWTQAPAQFMAAAPASAGFRWLSDRHEAARAAAPDLTFLGLPVHEAVARCSETAVTEVDLSIFNRGDGGDIAESVFDARLAAVAAALQTHAGRPREMAPPGPARAGRTVRVLLWETRQTYFRLEHARSRRRSDDSGGRVIQPEYATLSLRPLAGTRPSDLSGEDRADVSRSALRRRVVRTPDGGALLDSVPMVDQGQKGYCAVAAAERVMRYYGLAVDQHKLAQQAATASGGGTDPEALRRALHSMVGRLGLNLWTIETFTATDFTRLIADYNRAARKQKLPEIVLPTAGVIEMNEVYGRMDRPVFLAARTHNPGAVDRFGTKIEEKIAAGVPLVWGVVLGFVPETPALPQATGGHLRLLIGLNPKTREVLYTDSWGPGHELKRMNLANAYAITTCLFTLEPQ